MKIKLHDAPSENLYGRQNLGLQDFLDNDEQNKSSEDTKELKILDSLILGCLVLLLSILPLVSALKVSFVASPFITGYPGIDSGYKADIFTYYKFVFLISLTSIVLLLFLYKSFIVKNLIEKSYIHFPLFVLSIVILLSLVLSPYKDTALYGLYNRHEGTITYLCGLLLFFIASHTIFTLKSIRTLTLAVVPVVLVNAVLAISSFFGSDWIHFPIIKSLLQLEHLPEGASINEMNLITTLNNPNYLSGFSAVCMVVFLGLALSLETKVSKVLYTLLALISFATLLSSLSSSGFVTILVMIPALLILAWKFNYAKKGMMVLLSTAISSVLIFCSFGFYNSQVWDETLGILVSKNPFSQKASEISSGALLDKLQQYVVPVAYAETNNPTSSSNVVQEYKLPEISPYGISAGAGRLYIWEHTLDLILDRPFWGYGLDTIVYEFPQNDPLKNSGLGNYTTYVDKPHNMYLGLAYGAGFFALLAFLFLVISHIRKSFSYLKTNTMKNPYFICFFIGWLAFLFQGLFNDMVIGVSPVFWILFGVTVSMAQNKLKTTD